MDGYLVRTLEYQHCRDSQRPIDIDFWDDILENIHGAVFLVGGARKDRLGIFADLAYNDIEFEKNTPGAYFFSLSSRTKTWMVAASGFYRR